VLWSQVIEDRSGRTRALIAVTTEGDMRKWKVFMRPSRPLLPAAASFVHPRSFDLLHSVLTRTLAQFLSLLAVLVLVFLLCQDADEVRSLLDINNKMYVPPYLAPI